MNPQYSQNEFSGRQSVDSLSDPVLLRTIRSAQYLSSRPLNYVANPESVGGDSVFSRTVWGVVTTTDLRASNGELNGVSEVTVADRPGAFRAGLTTGLSASFLIAGLLGASPVQAAIVLGDSGGQVKAIQESLVQLGFDTGGVDGVFGPKTLRALIRFQQARNLQADGVVGPQTSQALAIVAPMGAGPELSSSGSGSGPAIVATTSQNGINIRQTPNGAVIGYAMDGVNISLTGRERSASGRTWLEIATGGWIAADFVRAGVVASAAPQPATYSVSNSVADRRDRLSVAAKAKTLTAGSGQVYVKASRLNIRSSPGGPVIGYAKSGTALQLTGNYKTIDGYEWAELASGGWVATPFLK